MALVYGSPSGNYTSNGRLLNVGKYILQSILKIKTSLVTFNIHKNDEQMLRVKFEIVS